MKSIRTKISLSMPRPSVLLNITERHLAPLFFGLAFLALLAACAAPPLNDGLAPASFADRCADPSVIRCFGFESGELAENGGPVEWSNHTAVVGTFVNGMDDGADLTGRVELDTNEQSSGQSSLKFYMPSRSGASYAGQFYVNFSDDLSLQFGEGEEFFVQWRQRFSKDLMLKCMNRYNLAKPWAKPWARP